MHVLFFTYDVPFPPNSGGKTRALNLLKYSQGSTITYTLFSFTRQGFDLSNLAELKKMGISHIELFPRKSFTHVKNLSAVFSKRASIFRSLYFEQSVAKTLLSYVKKHHVDLVHFESFYTGFYLSDAIQQLGIKQVYGSENIEYKVYEQMIPQKNKMLRPFIKKEVEKVKAEELAMIKTADRSLAVTPSEAAYFSKQTSTDVAVIENGVAIENFPKVTLRDNPVMKLLFIGNFSYFPNVDGLSHFYHDIFLTLPQDEFRLVVVGKGVSQLGFLNDAIEKIEYIPDVYDAYAMADIFVSPVRIGGGTNFKVLEAMAAGLPVVAYQDKTSDMGFINQRDILQAKNTDEFISFIKELKKDFTKRKMLGDNARTIVSKKYNWKTIGEKLHKVWTEL